MDSTQIINVVQSIGFPIVMCGAMSWFVFYMFNKNNEQVQKIQEQHQEEIQELQQAIDNNTIALTKVIDAINNINK